MKLSEQFKKLMETPPPLEIHKNKVYYHGTRNKEILKSEYINPGNLHDEKSTKMFTPMYNRSYLTTDIEYALTYAYGGLFSGLGGNSADSFFNYFLNNKNESPLICVVNGSDLTDIEPDEDIIASLIQNKFNYKGDVKTDLTLSDDEITITHFIKYNVNLSTLRKAMDDYGWGTKVGKSLLKKNEYRIKIYIDENWKKYINGRQSQNIRNMGNAY